MVLFFYPLDFGYISPSELLELETRRKELEKRNCKILAVSSDNVVVHEQFVSINPGFGGVHGIKFPLLEDKTAASPRCTESRRLELATPSELILSLTATRW